MHSFRWQMPSKRARHKGDIFDLMTGQDCLASQGRSSALSVDSLEHALEALSVKEFVLNRTGTAQ